MVLALSQPRIACAGPLDRRFVASKARSSSLVPVPRRSVKPKAFPDVSFIADLADAAPGSVDAPLPVVAGLAIAISAAALLIFSFGLKPGKIKNSAGHIIHF